MSADESIEEIRARALASTTGPFVLVPRGFEDYDVRRVGHEDSGFEMAGIRGMFGRKEDAEFFARAREDVLALLDALEAERGEESG